MLQRGCLTLFASLAGTNAEAAACVKNTRCRRASELQVRSCKLCAHTVLQVLKNAKEQWTEGKGATTTSAPIASPSTEKKSVVEQVQEGVASVTQNAQGGSASVQHIFSQSAEGSCVRSQLRCGQQAQPPACLAPACMVAAVSTLACWVKRACGEMRSTHGLCLSAAVTLS